MFCYGERWGAKELEMQKYIKLFHECNYFVLYLAKHAIYYIQ